MEEKSINWFVNFIILCIVSVVSAFLLCSCLVLKQGEIDKLNKQISEMNSNDLLNEKKLINDYWEKISDQEVSGYKNMITFKGQNNEKIVVITGKYQNSGAAVAQIKNIKDEGEINGREK